MSDPLTLPSPCGRGNARRGWRAWGLVWLALLSFSARAARSEESAPGTPLLAAAERAPLVVVGQVERVARLDGSAYAATLRVHRALRGAVGPAVPVAWEELARGRAPRLAPGQTVLLALDEVPSGSLWRERAHAHAGLRVIAGAGDALLVDPSPTDLRELVVYLALPPDAAPAARAAALARLADASGDALAAAALARLARADLAAALDAAATAALLRVAADQRRPLPLRAAVIELAAAARLQAAQQPLERLARPGGPLESEALSALGRIRGSLPPAQVEALLARRAPAVRAVGARYATGTLAERRLPELVRADSAPEVRAAAAEALAATRTVWGIDGCLPALADSSPLVRAAAAAALGRLGAPAVPALEDAARQVPAQAAGAVTALSLAGAPGAAALRRLAHDGPNEQVRDLAKLALGEGPHAH